MAAAVLVPCLGKLRAELNAIAPDRDRTSDGTIGDAAHQRTVSDHNDDEVGRVPIYDADSKHEIHAYDADADLRTAGLTMLMVVLFIIGRCRAGVENRLRYVIFNRTIWEASNAWQARPYTGSSPHTEHAHFSASYDTAREADTRPWRLEDIPVALTDADKKWLAQQIGAAAVKAAELVWKTKRNVNVGPRALDAAGNPRPPSDQELGSVLAHLSPEVDQVQQITEQTRDAVLSIKANLPTDAG